MQASIVSAFNNWRNRRQELRQAFVRSKDDYLTALRLGEAVGDRDLEQRYETLLEFLANYGLVDIPDQILSKIVELIRQIWKRQEVMGRTAGVAYIYSLVEDLRLIRAKNDSDVIFGEQSDIVLLYALLDVASKRRKDASKIFSAIQKYDWKINIGPLLIALAQSISVNRLEEFLSYAESGANITQRDLGDIYYELYRRIGDVNLLKKALMLYINVDEEKAVMAWREVLSMAEDLKELYSEIEDLRSPLRFGLVAMLLAEALRRKQRDFVERAVVDKEAAICTLKQCQSLTRELALTDAHAALSISRKLTGDSSLFALLGVLQGTKDLDVATEAIDEIVKRLPQYAGEVVPILKQVVAASVKLDIWDELILSVPDDAPWLSDFVNLMSDALRVAQGSAETEVRLTNLETPAAKHILERLRSGSTREPEWFDPTWFSNED